MPGFVHEPFLEVRYYSFGATGSGQSVDDPAALAAGTLSVMSLDAGSVVEDAYLEVMTAVTGSTALDLGDGADPDGYVPTASVTLATPAVYGAGEDEKGALLHDGTSTQSKRVARYTAAGAVNLTVTGTTTAGKVMVVVKGWKRGN